MSAFLGPIHHWLFKKIVLFEDLEKNIVSSISNEYDKKKVKEITTRLQDQYGDFIPQQPLEELIDTDNIHGWLQSKISIAEIRQAATIREFIDVFGMDIVAKIKDVYKEQGMALGKELASNGSISNAMDLYKELNNFLLEGMPCDNVNNVVSSSDEEVKWQITQCLHRPYWDQVDMNANIMYNLRFTWIQNFIENANPNYTYDVDLVNNMPLHSIFLK